MLQSERQNGRPLIELEKLPIRRSSDDGVAAAGQPLVSKSWYELGGETFVAMMQAADSRDGDEGRPDLERHRQNKRKH